MLNADSLMVLSVDGQAYSKNGEPVNVSGVGDGAEPE
jgi:hypothetical protein